MNHLHDAARLLHSAGPWLAGDSGAERDAWLLAEGLAAIAVAAGDRSPALSAAARTAQVRDLVHRDAVLRIEQSFRECNLPGLLLKGEDSARRLYPNSAWRPRSDIDLWVHPARIDDACRALERVGFDLFCRSGRGLARFECVLAANRPAQHAVDLHIRPFVRPWRTCLDSFDREWQERQRLPGFLALGLLEPASALLNQVFHLAKNTHWRRIWLLDVALLQARFPAAVASARARCPRGDARVFDQILSQCEHAQRHREPILFARHTAKPAALLRDLLALPDFAHRLAFLMELRSRPKTETPALAGVLQQTSKARFDY